MKAYYGVTRDTPDDQARSIFRNRYGQEPEEIINTAGGKLVGPIPGNKTGTELLQGRLFTDGNGKSA